MNNALRHMGVLILLIRFIAPSVDNALAGECRLNMIDGILSGESRDQEMGKVMGLLSEKTGIIVYLDHELEKTPVTFRLAEGIPAELAVRRIVKPFSFVLFMQEGAGVETAIREIWIFRKGPPPGSELPGLRRSYIPAAFHREVAIRWFCRHG